jgi:endonuclease I
MRKHLDTANAHHAFFGIAAKNLQRLIWRKPERGVRAARCKRRAKRNQYQQSKSDIHNLIASINHIASYSTKFSLIPKGKLKKNDLFGKVNNSRK